MEQSPTSHESGLKSREIRNLVAKNMVISVLARILQLGSRLFLPPITLAYVSLEEYGIWAVCFILIGYLGMGAFGVSNVYIRYIAEYHANHQTQRINGLMSTGIIFVCGICAVLMGVLWFSLPDLIEHSFHISPHLRQTAFILIYGAASIFILELIMGAFIYLLEGLQRFAVTALASTAASLLETGLAILLLFLGVGIYSLLYAFIARYIFYITACVRASYRELPELSVHIRNFSTHYLPLFFRFGAIAQAMGILSIVVQSLEKLIASMSLGVVATGLLDVGSKLPSTATSIPAAMTSAFLPASSYLHTQNRKVELSDMYLRGSRSMNLITGLLMGFLMAFAHQIMMLWLGNDPKYLIAVDIMMLFTLPQQTHILTGLGSAIFYGIEKPILTLSYPLLRIGLLLPFAALYWLNLVELNIINLVLAVTATTLLSALIYLIQINRYMGVSHWKFFLKVLLPGAFPYACGFTSLWVLNLLWTSPIINRASAFSFLLTGGILYCLIVLPGIYWGVYDSHGRAELRVLILRGIVFLGKFIPALRR
jgi:O-antigen/teichoic acid export membrane protein